MGLNLFWGAKTTSHFSIKDYKSTHFSSQNSQNGVGNWSKHIATKDGEQSKSHTTKQVWK